MLEGQRQTETETGHVRHVSDKYEGTHTLGAYTLTSTPQEYEDGL